MACSYRIPGIRLVPRHAHLIIIFFNLSSDHPVCLMRYHVLIRLACVRFCVCNVVTMYVDVVVVVIVVRLGKCSSSCYVSYQLRKVLK